jgi:hypothetical protein
MILPQGKKIEIIVVIEKNMVSFNYFFYCINVENNCMNIKAKQTAHNRSVYASPQ